MSDFIRIENIESLGQNQNQFKSILLMDQKHLFFTSNSLIDFRT